MLETPGKIEARHIRVELHGLEETSLNENTIRVRSRSVDEPDARPVSRYDVLGEIDTWLREKNPHVLYY